MIHLQDLAGFLFYYHLYHFPTLYMTEWIFYPLGNTWAFLPF